MTNLEWFKKRINEISVEELGKAWETEEAPWCDRNCGDTEDACIICVERWATKPHEKPMPELKTGMFVEVENCGFGVVVNDEIVFQNGTHGEVEYLKRYIVKVFETYCFKSCDDDVGIIWERN